MRIEVEAKLILNVPEPKKEDTIPDVVLAAEQQINNGAVACFALPETKTMVGIRIHVGEYREVPQ